MYVVVKTLTMAPGQCKMCGSANKEWYLDTGTSEEFYGAIYYCCDCMKEMAYTCGFRDSQPLNDKITELTAELDQRTKFESEFRAICGRIADGSITTGPAMVSAFSNLINEESTLSFGTGTGETDESSNDEGLAVVPNDGRQEPAKFKFFE